MPKRIYINKLGQEVTLDIRDGEPLPDGFGLRVPSYLCDGVPQAIAISDEDAREAAALASYNAHKAWLRDAWKTPSPPVAAAPERSGAVAAARVSDAAPDANASWREMVRRTENAWRAK